LHFDKLFADVTEDTVIVEAGFRSLFDANDGLRQLKYLRIGGIASFNDSCVDALTRW
jgi:hypothetical protein